MPISTTKKFLGATVVAGVILALSGCAQAPDDAPGADSTAVPEGSDFHACIVSDDGGFDDKSFNQSSFEGAKRATDEVGAEFSDVESHADTDYAPNINGLISSGCTTLVAVGFKLSAATVEAALANPNMDFILVDDAADNDFDGEKDAPNVKPLLYDTAEAAFLAGYLAAGYSSTGKVGTFGGMQLPTVTIFMDGFKQGVDYYNSENNASVQVIGWDGTTGSFTDGFQANQQAKTVAVNIIDQGVDVLMPVGGPIYQSALQAIQESGDDIALIGVDADLYETDPNTRDYVLTSVLKAMDVSVYEAVLSSAQGAFNPELYVGTLENGGVGLAEFHNFTDRVDPALVAAIEELRQSIINGDVTVDSYLD